LAGTITHAISSGIVALGRMQAGDGSFPFFTRLETTAWKPCGRLFSTAYVMLGAGRMLPRDSIARAMKADNAFIDSVFNFPSLSEAYVNRGAALINLDRPGEAVTALDRAISLGLPKVHLAYYNRAMAKEALNDVRGAYNDLRKVIELQPDYVLALEQLKRFSIVGGQMRMSDATP
jgi:tetratricopeptide (TPR) repeat protein